MQDSRYVPRGEALGMRIEVLVICNDAGRSKQAAARSHLNDLPTARAPPGHTRSQRQKVEPMVAPHRLDTSKAPLGSSQRERGDMQTRAYTFAVANHTSAFAGLEMTLSLFKRCSCTERAP